MPALSASLDMNQNSQPEAQAEVVRYIPSEQWERLFPEIYRLYIEESSPLESIRRRMQRDYFFHATIKQWKEQLARWSLKRNLSCADAAHILRLHLDAENRGSTLHVFFFNKEKTLADIRLYIRKSKVLGTDRDLLHHLTGDLPHYVGIDAPYRPSHVPIAAPGLRTQAMGSNFSTSPPVRAVPKVNRGSTSSQHTGSPWSLVGPEGHSSQGPSPSLLGLSTPLAESVESEIFDESCHQGLLLDSLNDLEPKYKYLALNASSISPTNLLAVTQPFLCPDAKFAGLQCDMSFHGLMSASPIQAVGFPGLGENQESMLSDPMRSVLGNFGSCEQFNTFNDSSWFLVNCIQGCIYRGQKQHSSADRRFAEAMASFEAVTIQRREECLTVLTVLVALFESYGHRDVVKGILEGVYRVMSGRFGDTNPMTRTVRFMQCTQSLEPGKSGLYDINELFEIYNCLCSQYSACSWLSLTAQYNVAWAQLENKNIVAARQILMELKPLCETAFGPLHLQTIVCSATLARAQFHNGELQPAQALLDEVVLGRIRKVFTISHPYYWEAQSRHAKFMIALSNNYEHIHAKRQSLRQTAEELLREVLLWRFTILGTANPRTTDTFHTLQKLLTTEGKTAEAGALFYWCDNNCQQERDLLMGDEYVLT